jgi:hypothetical protein
LKLAASDCSYSIIKTRGPSTGEEGCPARDREAFRLRYVANPGDPDRPTRDGYECCCGWWRGEDGKDEWPLPEGFHFSCGDLEEAGIRPTAAAGTTLATRWGIIHWRGFRELRCPGRQ